MTGFYFDPLFLEHETGSHPENRNRLEALQTKFEQDPVYRTLDVKSSVPAERFMIERVHSPAHINRLEEAALSGKSYLDTPDCVISEQTYSAALNASGALCLAVSEVAEAKIPNAFVAARPPGHHAEKNQAMGFCFFNSVAIAAEHLKHEFGYKKILIFDFDVHHGNGTQHTFEDRNDVFYASIHQHPATLFPGTGYSNEKGTGEGGGFTLNVPMAPHSEDRDYKDVFESTLLPAFQNYQPDFILISAGFDAHRDDPLAMMNLTETGFNFMTKEMVSLAEDLCEGRIVSVLEGGYHYQRLSECALSHVKILNGS